MSNNFRTYTLEEKNELKFFKSEKLNQIEGIGHAFTTRVGGISPKPFDSLNIYSIRPEEKDNALENRKKLGKVLDINIENAVLAQQVHGKNVHQVLESDKSKGFFDHNTAIPETDALITNIPDIPIMLLFADCLPLLMADKKTKTIAVIHAGWKGTEQEIAKETINKMINNYNSKLEDIYVAIGIGIGTCCFEIQKDTKDKLERVSYSENCFETRDGKLFANLTEINKSQLINLGLLEENIDYNIDLCTFCDSYYFYSYRRDNQITGRHSAIIWIN
ncbi:MAG: peptidoglycan editing factor PgeF [Cyanobacteriota bacterium]